MIGSNGLTLDPQGRLIITAMADRNVVRLEKDGTRTPASTLGTLQLPQITGEPRPRICASNLAFGGPGNETLFITACTHLFRVRLNAAGIVPGPPA
ncbi:MAG TPA: hypothetical protein VH639_22055 [Bryobacteraceae bacterium]